MFRHPDHWVWDSWIADDGELFHLFFLQAPRRLGDQDLRHTHASIGHAVSADLQEWSVRPDALVPLPGGWDDLALWTGSCVRSDDGRWWMFYTAINTRGHALRDQRIGAAVSEDLTTWQRVGGSPLLGADPRWYETLDEDARASETWRDPFVFRDPQGDGWHMLVCARGRGVARLDAGVLAHARSADLVTWEVGPPLTQPGFGFGQLEVAQVRVVEGRPLLVFTCHPEEQSPARRARWGDWCTWSVVGDSILGPWDLAAARPFTAEPELFAAPLVQVRDESWALIGFRNSEARGPLALEIIDPVPVTVADGALRATDGFIGLP